MLQKEQVDKILNNIFKTPEELSKCDEMLRLGNIANVVDILTKDKAFSLYFLAIVRKADFYVDTQSKDVGIIAHLLGVDMFKFIIHSYFVFLKLPKDWRVFSLNTVVLIELNAKILSDWNKILINLNSKTQRNLLLAPYMLTNVIAYEMVFANYIQSLNEIVNFVDIDYINIFKKMYNVDIFFKSCLAAGWDINKLNNNDKNIVMYLKFLLSYEISRPKFNSLGLDKILDIKTDTTLENLIKFKKCVGANE
ncbi:hypothetical protein KDD93_04035 [Campylobacter sp. faydin G-24]|uniref:HDOD domain-containing protein n=1 Tax=Campylobacter anatolicus TaxID=2829105 RepID=A0ABS5HHI5_9BACT|nr:hypothetical protein [Campylobacter anatolicus]MBR8463744.1 hypothetical protein [Campylobacter anatolicus]MBR8464776.1 hypothetical protein [Campylobacter anatolicus]